MNPRFFEQPILNSPYEAPSRHWELDDSGQPTHRIIEARRQVRFLSPIPAPKKRRGASQLELAPTARGRTSISSILRTTAGRR